MANYNLKRGHDLKITGLPQMNLIDKTKVDFVSLHPGDHNGIKPKMLVRQGDSVLVGSPLFYDKLNPDVRFVSPISGVVSEIELGERRFVNKILIKNDYESKKIKNDISSLNTISSDKLRQVLLESGLWTNLRQMPFSKIPKPKALPRDIFISAYSTAPFSCDSAYILKGREKFFQTGLDALSKLTTGKVHLNIAKNELSEVFRNAKNVNINTFTGKHPAGNIGVQIHHIKPIKSRDDIVWYLDVQTVADIGNYLLSGRYPNVKIISVGGSYLKSPSYCKITKSSMISSILNDNLDTGENYRVISGDILSGETRKLDDGIRSNDSILSIIPESTDREFLGWALPGIKKYSLSRTFLSSLFAAKKSALNTSMNGSHRAIVSFARWERVLPMDILPEFLVKSILARDIEEMEKLGIYECTEEDFALCSFVCQSKTDVSGIIRDGLAFIDQEG